MVTAERAIEIDTAALAAKLREAHEQLQRAQQAEEQARKHHDRTRDFANRRRIELGKMLREARPNWPNSSKHQDGWGDFLREVGIEPRNADNWQLLAEAAEILETAGRISEISDLTLDKARAIVAGEDECAVIIATGEPAPASTGEPAPVASPRRAASSKSAERKLPGVEVLARVDVASRRRLCKFRLCGTLITLIQAETASFDGLRSQLDAPNETTFFKVKNNDWKWDEFDPEVRNSVLVEWISTLEAAVAALRQLSNEAQVEAGNTKEPEVQS